MRLFRFFAQKFLLQFSLEEDSAHEEETIAYIKKGVEFQGVNAWVLVFAIFIASIGLNVNSTAVIIGAMLISPLMGPIMGMGLSVGIFDFALLKRSFTNLSFMVVISIATSFLYFLISPLTTASSELISRTTPTIWDVGVAFFGGMAGIIVGASKDKGNPIPGVAIATALMPPLCTAGYGLANRQLDFFFGGFYLFFINTVMIGFSTVLVVRLLRFKQASIPDTTQRVRVKRTITTIVIITVLPSIWLAFNIVEKNVFEVRLNDFMNSELSFPNSQVILRNFDTKPRKSATFLLIGEPIPEPAIHKARESLNKFRLQDADIIIRQGTVASYMEAMQDSLSTQKSSMDKMLQASNKRIQNLQFSIDSLKMFELKAGETQNILQELKTIAPNIVAFSTSERPMAIDTTENRYWVVMLNSKGEVSDDHKKTLNNFLLARLKQKQLQINYLTENPLIVKESPPKKAAKAKKK
ncbi:MAG: DUF389 domain-containing protein [Fibrobacter sp.]|nr:DUF389 domain-containing protein [Fibrobacter sp.]